MFVRTEFTGGAQDPVLTCYLLSSSVSVLFLLLSWFLVNVLCHFAKSHVVKEIQFMKLQNIVLVRAQQQQQHEEWNLRTHKVFFITNLQRRFLMARLYNLTTSKPNIVAATQSIVVFLSFFFLLLNKHRPVSWFFRQTKMYTCINDVYETETILHAGRPFKILL